MGLVALSLSKNFFDPPVAAPQKELSPAETARKVLPNIGGDITIDTNRDVEVMQIRIDHSGPVRLTGIVQNNTSHAIRLTDIVFNLTNKSGSQVGAVNCRIDNLAPKATQEFQIPLKQQDAAFALVREVSTSR